MTLKRVSVLFWIFASLFALVEAQVVHLQFVTREFWETEAQASRIGGEPIPFRRGSILDRYDRPFGEGETVHRLSLLFQEFRRESPIGQLIGAGRLITAQRDEPAPQVHDVLADPGRWLDLVLELSEATLEPFDNRQRDDVGFYVRKLLGLSSAAFREAREVLDDVDAPFYSLAPGCREPLIAAVRQQAAAFHDLAQAVGSEPEAFLLQLEEEIDEIDVAVARSIRRSSLRLSPKQIRAIRKDHETRDRVLERSVPYRAVYLVNRVPERYTGFRIRDVIRRSYPEENRDVATTLIGWVGYPTEAVLDRAEQDVRKHRELRSQPPDELDMATSDRIAALSALIRHHNYRSDEEQGRWGLEALLEPVLRGRRGWRIAERDSSHRDTRLLEMIPSVSGQDVRLTLDLALQRACERVLAEVGEKAAIVLIDPRDGALRALASWPTPTRSGIEKHFGELVNDPDGPIYQRTYRPPGNPPPPGSVFKVVAAAAALEEGVIHPGSTFVCERLLRVGQTRLKCMAMHGEIDLVTALEKSCNIYFYKMSRVLGVEPMVRMAERFGLGRATRFGEPDYLGLPDGSVSLGELECPFQGGAGVLYAMRTSIGHAAIDDITPVQVAMMMAAVANGGYRVRPYLINSIGERPARREPLTRIGLDQDTIAAIQRGMVRAAISGTARPRGEADLRPYRVAAKTGTPQEAKAADHAWIAGYFPHDRPRLAFAIFLEHVGQGGGSAGTPVLARLLAQPEFQQ